MENAGRSLAELTIARWQPARVVVLAGTGGNGGGGLVAARHLANRGSDVEVVLSDPGGLAAVPAHQRTILDAMRVPVHDSDALPGPLSDLLAGVVVIDALLGYSLDGDPREPAASLIRAVTAVGSSVVALDLPSGLEATSGRIGDPCITAEATLGPLRWRRRATKPVSTGLWRRWCRTRQRKQSTRMLGPMLGSLGYLDEVLRTAGPGAARDLAVSAPPMLLGARGASVFRWLLRRRRGPALLVSTLVLIAVIVTAPLL